MPLTAADVPVAETEPAPMLEVAEPPMEWPISAEPQLPAAASPAADDDASERMGCRRGLSCRRAGSHGGC